MDFYFILSTVRPPDMKSINIIVIYIPTLKSHVSSQDALQIFLDIFPY